METVLSGHVLPETILEMVTGFVRNGGGEVWLIDASGVLSYDARSIRVAIDAFTRLGRENGLRRLAAYVKQPAVRMGAITVAMSLRAMGALVQIDVIGDRDELERLGA